jgi:predicted outer membrane repeat protein
MADTENMIPRRPSRLLPGLLIFLVSLAGLVGAASAAVIRVPDDYTTISAALAAATSGEDVIYVSDAGSPYVERITLKSGVSVMGGFDSSFTANNPDIYVTVIQAPPGTGTIVDAADTQNLAFSGFTVTGAEEPFAGGGIFCGAGSSPFIANCTIRGNQANTGAGIQVSAGASPMIYQCTFEENTATLRGGGIAVAAGADLTTIELCTIRACSSAVGGQSAGGGGGAYVAAPIWFARNRIEDNYTGNDGGGLYVKETDLRSWANLLRRNVAGRNGGGIYHQLGNSEHDEILVENCQALGSTSGGNGGGIYCEGGTNRFFASFIRGNAATAGGGGFYLAAADAEIRLCEINLNAATEGGGIFIAGGSTAFTLSRIYSNTIAGNSASLGAGGGGGFHVEFQDVSEIVNNVVAMQTQGCGIYCVGIGASPNLRYNCFFNLDSENTDPEYGGDCDDRTGINGNIAANPRFCDRNDDPPDLALQTSSPCLGSGEGGVDMGAHDASVACSTISIEETSWGKIKARYR